MTIQTHNFTKKIREILDKNFGKLSEIIFEKSILLKYLNIKTKSAESGSKARGSFGNIYAIYVLVEDYLKLGYDKKEGYKSHYEGSNFINLFRRQRELPFGDKLQNHALNNRLNDEFYKFFPFTERIIPIIRDVPNNKYWFNENLLKIQIEGQIYNIAQSVIQIIDEYVNAKENSFRKFIKNCEEIAQLDKSEMNKAKIFIESLIAPNIDARIFEIVSYSVLKYYYDDQIVYFGYNLDNIEKHKLELFKTGRTNANDGGIDFVMRPLGRFFQVTETTDIHKYFLDIDKIRRFPITFVVKSQDSINELKRKMEEKAVEIYGIVSIVKKYMECIEEIINIPILIQYFEKAVTKEYLKAIIQEIILQSKVEFNLNEN